MNALGLRVTVSVQEAMSVLEREKQGLVAQLHDTQTHLVT